MFETSLMGRLKHYTTLLLADMFTDVIAFRSGALFRHPVCVSTNYIRTLSH